MYQKFLSQITEYIFAEDQAEKADIIFVPGNAYPQNAEKAAELYRRGLAPYVLPSGRYSVTVGHFAGAAEKKEIYSGNYETEWEFLRDVLIKNGVPENAVLKEDRATYTYENALYSLQVTEKAGIAVRTAILCCRNCHARRSLMYYQRVFPETRFLVCPSVIGGITKENWNQTREGVEAVTGEVDRIITQFSLLMKEK